MLKINPIYPVDTSRESTDNIEEAPLPLYNGYSDSWETDDEESAWAKENEKKQ